MKRYILPVFFGLLAIISSKAIDAQVIWQEDFESYVVDSIIDPQSADWVGWGNTVTSALVSGDESASGVKSLKIWEGNPNGSAAAVSDLLHLFGDSTTGRYFLKFKVFVPSVSAGSGAGVYWNIQHEVDANNTGLQWAMEVQLREKGLQSTIEVGGLEYPIPTVYDKWVDVVHIFDLDRDSADFFYNNQFITSNPFSYQAGSTTGLNQLSALNLFATCDGTTCTKLGYFDDFVFSHFGDQQNDAGISSINSEQFCPGSSYAIEANLRNFGYNTLSSATINWSIDGVAQTAINFTGNLLPGEDTSILLANHLFGSNLAYDIKVWTSGPNAVADTVNFNDSMNVTLNASLQGILTIDTSIAVGSGNYHSFASLASDLNNRGICGPVTINVAAATYHEQLSLSNIAGASAVNTITIDGGDSSSTIISHDATTIRPVILLDGTQYLTIKNLGVVNTASSNSVGILLTNKADHNAILNSYVRVDNIGTVSSNGAIISSGSLTSLTTAGSNASHLNIENNRIIGGYYGIRLNGTSSALDYANYIHNNVLDSTYLTGIYLSDLDSVVVENNYLNLQARANTGTDGIWLNECMNFFVLSNNVNVPDYGIYALDANSDFTPRLRAQVANNMVVSTGDYGIYLNDALDIDVFHNSVSVFGTTQDAFYLTGTASNNLDIRNNIFASQNSPAFDYNEDSLTLLNLDFNIYYSPSATLVRFDGVNFADLPSFLTAQPTFNVNSLEGNPNYVDSTSNLHILGSLANDVGDNAVGISVDIDGDSRPMSGSTTVDIGADEFDPPSCFPVSVVELLNSTLGSLELNFNDPFNTYEIEYGLIGFTQGSGNYLFSFSDTILLSGLQANNDYDVYVRKICGGRDTSIWVGPFTYQTLNAVPYFQDFEKFGPSTTIDKYGWSTLVSPTSSSLDWETDFETPSASTGPEEDHTIGRGGIFVFLESSGGANGDYSDLISTNIYVDSAYTTIDLSFWYHKYGSTMGDMEVYIDSSNQPILLDVITADTQLDQLDPWLKYSRRLTGFEGKTVRIIIRGFKSSNFYGDMAIDDFELDFVPANNAGIAELIDPIGGVICQGSTSPTVRLANYGYDTLKTVSIKYSINGILDSVQFTGNIPPSSSQAVSLNAINLSPNTNYDIQIYTELPNGVVDIKTEDDTLSFFNVQTSMPGGVYTIDTSIAISSSNFHTISAAVNALITNGICGPVTFNIAPAVYYEQITINQAIKGSSAINTITFDGGDSSASIISHNGTTVNATILLDGASHITFSNLGIINTASTGSVGVQFMNMANHNTLKNNHIAVDASATSSTNAAIVSSSSLTSTTADGSNASYLKIENNRVIGGYYSIRLNGGTSILDFGNEIRNNIVENTYLTGIYVSDQDSVVIDNNYLDLQARAYTGTDGIWLNESMNFHVLNNYVNVPDYGIHAFDANSDFTPRERAQLINNMVISTGDYGIYLNDALDVDVFHNSVSVFGSTQDAFYLTGTASNNLDIRNNIFVSQSSPAFDYNEPVATILNWDHNIYFSGGSVLARIDGTDYATLSDLQTAFLFNNNSLQGDPVFKNNASDLHILVGSLLANDVGDNSVGVSTDFDGQSRPIAGATIVDIGADEFSPPALNANVASIVHPAGALCPGTVTPIVGIANSGTDTIKSVSVIYSINGILDTVFYAGIIAPSDTQNVSLNPITASAGVSYNIHIYTSMPNGLADELPSDDTLSFIGLQTGLDGNYTIDPALPVSASNFQSFSQAANALNYFGVCNAVSFNVAPGVYNENIVLNQIGNSSAVNTITFDGTDSSMVILKDNGSNLATVLLNGTDYLTIQNMGIENSGTSNAAILFGPGSHNNTVQNSQLKVGGSTSSSSMVISFSGSTESTTTNAAISNYNLIQNNRLVNGYYGVRMYADIDNHNTYNRFFNNRIDSINNYGIYAYYQDSLEIVGNKIDAVNGSTGADGIYSYYSLNTIISENYVHAYDYGVYVFSLNLPTNAQKKRKYEIINNMIISESDYGLYMYYGDSVNIYHNTISVRGSSPALQLYTTTAVSIENYDVRNNIFDGGSALAIRTNTPAAMFDILDYNLYYSTGSDLASIDGITYADLSAFNTAYPMFNINSIEGKPLFRSPSDLHMDGYITNNVGDNTVGVSQDIDGDSRPIATDPVVDIGADEFVIPPIDANVYALIAPFASSEICYSNADTLIIGIANSGMDTLDLSLNNMIVNVVVSGASNQAFTDTLTNNSIFGGPIVPRDSVNIGLGDIDMSQIGHYYFEINVETVADGISSNNTFRDTLEVLPTSAGLISGSDSICFGDSAILTAENTVGELQWQELVNGIWTNINGADSASIIVSPINSSEYRLVACDTAFSDTFKLAVISVPAPTLSGDSAVVYCGDSADLHLQAFSSNSNAKFLWYDSEFGGNSLKSNANISISTDGDSLRYTATPLGAGAAVIDTFYVSEIFGSGSSKNVGALNPNDVGTGGYVSLYTYKIYFTVKNYTTIESVDIYTQTGGNSAGIEILEEPSLNVVFSNSFTTVAATSTSSGQTVELNAALAPGNYSMKFTSNSAGSYYRNTNGSSFPYSLSDIELTGHNFSGYPQYYYYFYNWQMKSGCESDRVAVVAKAECIPVPDLALNSLVSPNTSSNCFSSTEDVEVLLVNPLGRAEMDFSTDSFDITVNVSGAISQTFNYRLKDNSLNGGLPLAEDDSLLISMGTLDMTDVGSYNFEAYLSSNIDTVHNNDTINTVIVNATSAGLLSGIDSICGSDFVTLSATASIGNLQWQRLVGSTFVDESGADSSSYEVYLDSTTTFRAIACGTEISDTITVVSIELPNAPTTTNDTINTMCGLSGSAVLTAGNSTSGVLSWYDAASGGNLITTGDTLLHNYSSSTQSESISYSDTFYVAESYLGCEGTRAMAIAVINIETPTAPIAVHDTAVVFCGDSGTATITAISQNSSESLKWYDSMSGGNLISTNDSLQFGLNTSTQAATTIYSDTFYVASVDSISDCESARTMVVAAVVCTVGEEEMHNSLQGISIRPNPSKGIFYLIGNNVDEELQISIFNSNGIMVYELENKMANSFNKQIDLSGLAKGIYFVKIQGKDSMEMRKIVIH